MKPDALRSQSAGRLVSDRMLAGRAVVIAVRVRIIAVRVQAIAVRVQAIAVRLRIIAWRDGPTVADVLSCSV
jgi:hypothetical protein